MTSGTVNIGIVTGSSNILCHTERIAGFMKTLVPYRDRIHVIDTVEIHDDEVESYEKTTALLSEHPRSMRCFCCRRCLWRLPQCGSFGAKRFRPDHCFRSGPYHETDVGKWHDCRYYLPAAKIQGSKPLSLLFAYLTTGETPEKEYNYTAVDIRIKENL